MSISRKRALERIDGLALQVEKHLGKLATEPGARASSHWRYEVRLLIGQMRDALPHVGRKTVERWSDRIETWEGQLPGDDDE